MMESDNSIPTNLGDKCCCQPGTQDYRMLLFPDGSKVGITGLGAAMEQLYKEGKPAEPETARELMKRLEKQNYFAAGARQLYQELFLLEYRRFLAAK